MGIKLAALYVLPYVVSIAGSLLAANEVALVVMPAVIDRNYQEDSWKMLR